MAGRGQRGGRARGVVAVPGPARRARRGVWRLGRRRAAAAAAAAGPPTSPAPTTTGARLRRVGPRRPRRAPRAPPRPARRRRRAGAAAARRRGGAAARPPSSNPCPDRRTTARPRLLGRSPGRRARRNSSRRRRRGASLIRTRPGDAPAAPLSRDRRLGAAVGGARARAVVGVAVEVGGPRPAPAHRQAPARPRGAVARGLPRDAPRLVFLRSTDHPSY